MGQRGERNHHWRDTYIYPCVFDPHHLPPFPSSACSRGPPQRESDRSAARIRFSPKRRSPFRHRIRTRVIFLHCTLTSILPLPFHHTTPRLPEPHGQKAHTIRSTEKW